MRVRVNLRGQSACVSVSIMEVCQYVRPCQPSRSVCMHVRVDLQGPSAYVVRHTRGLRVWLRLSGILFLRLLLSYSACGCARA